jgi:lysozyme family protein
LVALAAASRAEALQSVDDLRRVLGTPVPEPLRAIVPHEAFAAADFVRDVLALEAEAKTLRLPKSALSLHEGEVPTDPERLYELVLPRLVALIDRSERRRPIFAEKAGGLLAKLHGTQFVVPEGYAGSDQPLGPGIAPLGFGAQVVQVGPLTLPPVVPPVTGEPEPLPEPAPSASPSSEPPETDEPEVPDQLSRSIKFADLAEEYRAFYATLALRPEHRESAEWHRTMIAQSRSRYEKVEARTGVPWYFVGAVHGLEASFNFRAHLHNGDFPLSQRTRQVPPGRPRTWLPPSDWESSAVDALRLMGFAGEDDWSLPRLLYRIEAFNGFGYRRMARPTPYLWCFSNHYERGKYVADGKFDPRARSKQCGAAVMFKLLEEGGAAKLG